MKELLKSEISEVYGGHIVNEFEQYCADIGIVNILPTWLPVLENGINKIIEDAKNHQFTDEEMAMLVYSMNHGYHYF